jgi:hypothetical protein
VASEEPVTEQELREALNRLQISDLLVQSLSTTSSLAFHRLAPESRDLDQARLGIEALRALVPVLRDSLPAEVTRDFEAVTAKLQLAYAQAVEEERQPEPEPEHEEPPPT